MDVVLLRWPAEAARRDDLIERGVARLLLVEDAAAPPHPIDCLEDWIRVPAPELDLRARLAALEERSARHAPAIPTLDGDGVLRFDDAWVSLPPVEARLTRAMVDRFGSVVGRETLARAGWPEGTAGRNALDVHVLRLRRRLASVGLVIRTVRSRGYLLEAPHPGQQAREA
ncbi:MAG: two-component system, OmpR family, response regulator [Actinomycetota bacterium]|jgi:DNA-binding response OmpR family regulator